MERVTITVEDAAAFIAALDDFHNLSADLKRAAEALAAGEEGHGADVEWQARRRITAGSLVAAQIKSATTGSAR